MSGVFIARNYSTAEAIAREISEAVRRAVLMCPFNSKGCGLRGGHLVQYIIGNGHLGGKPALFVRTMKKQDYSGDYTLTPLGEEVRRVLERGQ